MAVGAGRMYRGTSKTTITSCHRAKKASTPTMLVPPHAFHRRRQRPGVEGTSLWAATDESAAWPPASRLIGRPDLCPSPRSVAGASTEPGVLVPSRPLWWTIVAPPKGHYLT